jgi:Ca-activated chloride channel family protein
VTIEFLHPWFLALLPLALLPSWRLWWRSRRAQHAVSHADVGDARAAGRSFASRFRALPVVLRMLAMALVFLSIARPVKANEQTKVRVEGIAIQLVLDRSGSMRAMDFKIQNEQTDRLTAIKGVARDFILGTANVVAGGELKGRTNDLIGLISFSRYADGLCPLTLDHDHLVKSLDSIDFATRDEDGTAIGEGLALSVERLKDVRVRALDDDGSNRAPSEEATVKSRVIILLTDGANTAGDIEPRDAAKLARSYGIRVYTIGVGTQGFAPFPGQGIFGERIMQTVPVVIDEALLKQIADETGGKYFRATDTASLASIYAEIDGLERTETESRRYLEYADFAVESVEVGSVRLPPILGVALVLIVADLLLALTRFRTLT